MGQNVVQKDISGPPPPRGSGRWQHRGGGALLEKNSELATLETIMEPIPVHVAAGLGDREMVDSLLKVKNLSENESGLKLLHSLASNGLYGAQ